MRVAYVHLARFPIQRRVVETPSLARQPFALVCEERGHRRVAYASTAALRSGVCGEMTLTEATALCPSLQPIAYVPEEEEKALRSLGEALMQLGPGYQLSGLDGLWLDGSAAGLCGGEEAFAARVVEQCAGHGYRARAVIAGELFTARAVARFGAHARALSRSVAASATPVAPSAAPVAASGPPLASSGAPFALSLSKRQENPREAERDPSALHAGPSTGSGRTGGLGAPSAPAPTRVIAPGGSRSALAPLPLSALEGEAAFLAASLRSLGLTTLGEVAGLPVGAVVARLGADGHRVHQLCRGEDDALLVPEPLAEVLEEGLGLDWPAESLEPLLFALKTSFDRLCARLAGRRRAAVRLVLSLRLDPRGEHAIPLRLARPSAQPKLLLDLAKHRIADLTLESPVSGVAVRVAESCEDRGQQLALGDGPEGDAALEVVLSRLAAALGEDALFSAEVDARHRPEAAYAPRPFRLERKAKGLLSDLPEERAKVAASSEVSRERPSRLFPKPAALDATLGEGGALEAARVLGKRRKVTAIAGPERLAGEWWAPEAYCRDYYRVQFEGVGPVWVYRDARDGRFYLHGMFD